MRAPIRHSLGRKLLIASAAIGIIAGFVMCFKIAGSEQFLAWRLENRFAGKTFGELLDYRGLSFKDVRPADDPIGVLGAAWIPVNPRSHSLLLVRFKEALPFAQARSWKEADLRQSVIYSVSLD